MIIVAPQLNGWDEESADETIALVEYLLSAYNIDKSKVYIEGYSGGGETASIAVSKRPDLFTAYLQVSSQWDGEYDSVAKAHLPVSAEMMSTTVLANLKVLTIRFIIFTNSKV